MDFKNVFFKVYLVANGSFKLEETHH